jgi:hypothetical protein
MKDGRQPFWVPKTLSQVLRNPTIAGRRMNKARTRTLMKVTPIVTPDVFSQIASRMDERAMRKGISQSRTPAMLTSIIQCGTCGRAMYRNGRPNSLGYYCVTCKAFVKVSVADQVVHDLMAADEGHDVETVVIKGTGQGDAVEEIKRDMHEAIESGAFDRLPALQSEVERLSELPADPPRIERRPAKQTVAQMWASLPDDGARRQYLLSRGIRVVYGEGFLTADLGFLEGRA